MKIVAQVQQSRHNGSQTLEFALSKLDNQAKAMKITHRSKKIVTPRNLCLEKHEENYCRICEVMRIMQEK